MRRRARYPVWYLSHLSRAYLVGLSGVKINGIPFGIIWNYFRCPLNFHYSAHANAHAVAWWPSWMLQIILPKYLKNSWINKTQCLEVCSPFDAIGLRVMFVPVLKYQQDFGNWQVILTTFLLYCWILSSPNTSWCPFHPRFNVFITKRVCVHADIWQAIPFQ